MQGHMLMVLFLFACIRMQSCSLQDAPLHCERTVAIPSANRSD